MGYGLIPARVEAEDIIQAMCDDPDFALSMWKEISDGLHQGALLDEAIDLIKSSFEKSEKQALVGSLLLIIECLKMQIEDEE